MKIQILSDLHNEVNRLFIAGAKFATGDLRLAKLVPTLSKMGEKSPAMKRLADMTNDLLAATEPEDALLDLGVLLNAMLNTQGGTYQNSMAVQPAPNESFFVTLPQTAAPYSTLEPVVKALTTTGSSRLEAVKYAHDNEQINDFRLYSHISKGLADKHAELASYLAETVIPSIGAVMPPFLLNELDIADSGKANATRLDLLDALGYEKSVELAEAALSDGSQPVQIAAIRILGKVPAYEDQLLAYANDRKADVKEAALVGLIKMGSTAGKDKMLATLSSGKFKPAVEAAMLCNDPAYNPQIFDSVKKFYDEKVGIKDVKPKDADDFGILIKALGGKDEKYIFDFFVTVFQGGYNKKTRSGYVYLDVICDILLRHDNHQAALDTYRNVLRVALNDGYGYMASSYWQKAKHHYDAQDMFDIFVSFYRKDLLNRGYYGSYGSYHNHFQGIELDKRWADEFIKKQDIDQIGVMLESGTQQQKLLKYLALYVHKRETKGKTGYAWAEAISLLAKHMDAKDLAPVVQDIYEGMVDKKIKMDDWCMTRLADVFSKESVASKLFSGSEDVLENMKSHFSGMPQLNWYQQKLYDALLGVK